MIRFRLGEILASKRITATKIHEDTKIAKSTISTMVNNRSEMIRLSTINDLCMYLNINPGDLFEFFPFDLKCEAVFDKKTTALTSLNATITFEGKGVAYSETYFGIFKLLETDEVIEPYDYFGSDKRIALQLFHMIPGLIESENDLQETLLKMEIEQRKNRRNEVIANIEELIKTEAVNKFNMSKLEVYISGGHIRSGYVDQVVQAEE